MGGKTLAHMRVGFVGLGVMGGPMASHLARGGVDTTVWNRTASKTIGPSRVGAAVAPSLATLATDADVIFTCVGTTEDVRSCLEQMLVTARPGTLFVDHSTISPLGAKEIHDWLAGEGMRFLDAPITGGSVGAENGTLTIFCGGSDEDFGEALTLMSRYSKRAELVGGPGAGALMKMANQIAVGGALMGLCESLAFAEKAGLDLALTRDVVGSGAAGSWAFENYGPKILNRDWKPGFSVDNQTKDFGYCFESASELGLSLPGTEVVDRLLRVLKEAGRGGDTTAALFEVLTGEVGRP